MSNTLETVFHTTPETHASASGHWDRSEIHRVGKGAITAGASGDSPYLSIQFQNGPVKEHGVNGVQLTGVLKICLARYKMLNRSFPCRENALAITNLQQAIFWDLERTEKRTIQGVEGYDKPHLDEDTA